jgi:hypothetical protein
MINQIPWNLSHARRTDLTYTLTLSAVPGLGLAMNVSTIQISIRKQNLVHIT